MPRRPESRVYKHRGCGGVTVVSGDDYCILEFPHRSVTGTFCSKCQTFSALTDFDWEDTGENVAGYRLRLYAADMTWRAIKEGLLGNALSYRPPPLDGVFGDKTHFRWYDPPEPDAPAPPLQQVQGPTEGMPAEVTALGQADHLHFPHSILAQLHNDYRPIALACLLIVAVLAAVVIWVPIPFLKAISATFIPFVLAGLGVACVKQWPAVPCYAAFDTALVIIEGSEYTIVPWASMTQFNPTTGALTADGKEFTISTGVKQRGLLFQKIKDRVTNQLLPAALESLREGNAITFGPLTLRRTGIEREGNRLEWLDVKKVEVAAALSGHPQIAIYQQGNLMAWGKCRLDQMANSFILVELTRRSLPPHTPLNGT